MKLNNGSEWYPTAEEIKMWSELYPAVDIEQELIRRGARQEGGFSDSATPGFKKHSSAGTTGESPPAPGKPPFMMT
jgi:hypothetical protein